LCGLRAIYITGRGKRTAFGAGSASCGSCDDKIDEFVSVSNVFRYRSSDIGYPQRAGHKIAVDHKPGVTALILALLGLIKPEEVIGSNE